MISTDQIFNITDRICAATNEGYDIISGTATVTGCWNCLIIFGETIFNDDVTSILVTDYSTNNPSPALDSHTKHYVMETLTGVNLSPLNGVVPDGFYLPKMYFRQITLSGGSLIALRQQTPIDNTPTDIAMYISDSITNFDKAY